MARFQSLLIDRANIRLPGLQVLSFAVHRHLPEHAAVGTHHHAWTQAIVYLGGSGVQRIGGAEAQIDSGSAVILPPGQEHAFVRRQVRMPQCVLIDFRLRGARRRKAAVATLSRSELAEIQQCVSRLRRLQSDRGEAMKWEGAIPVLQVLIVVLRAVGWLERTAIAPVSQPHPSVAALLDTVQHTTTLRDAITRSGYHRDHLNRLVKAHTGLTLGQYRAQQRLGRAKALLREGYQVAHVAAATGLPDQGYFARWFRRQTGQTPTAWARSQPVA